MVSNDFSFAMVNHATGLAECWGDVKYGGDCSGVNFAGVRQVGMELRVCSDSWQMSISQMSWPQKLVNLFSVGGVFGVLFVYIYIYIHT